MQNTEKNTDKYKKDTKRISLKTIGEKLREKDEAEVRSRLRFCVDFALTVAAAYMLGGARLLFSTYPLCLALLCSHRKKLLPISLGLIISAIAGLLPDIYVFACISVPLVRLLMACMPSVFSEMSDVKKSTATGIIRFNPKLPEKQSVGKTAKMQAGAPFSSLHIFEERLSMRVLAAALCGLLAGLFSMIRSNFSFYSLWGTLFLTAACPLSVLLLGGMFGGIQRKFYPLVSLMAAGAACVFAAKTMTVIGMPMAPFLAMLLTLFITQVHGLLPGGISAILFGLVLDPVYMPLLLICSLLFFLISSVRRGVGLAVVCAAVVVWCYYIGGTQGLGGILPPMLLAIPVYMMCDKYREIMCAPYNRDAVMAGGVYFAEAITEKNKNEAVRERLSALSEIFSALSETFCKLSDKRRRPDALGLKRICENEFDTSCKNCQNHELCYGSEYKTLLNVQSALTAALHSKGSVDKGDIGSDFRNLCPYSENIAKGINRAVSDATESMIKNEKLGFFASNYEDINEILRDALENDGEEYTADQTSAEKIFDMLYEHGFRAGGVVVFGKRSKNIVIKGLPSADKLSAKKADAVRVAAGEIVGAELGEPIFELGRDGTVMRLCSKPQFKAKCARGNIAAETDLSEPQLNTSSLYINLFDTKNEPDEICGDTSNSFITSSSYFYSLISDGMGNGEEAAFVSGVCSMFTEKMLSAGNRADITVRMLNNLLRNENMGRGGECSATVDLCELDLISGTASFIKSGAAPTYIVRSGTVYKVYSRTMPIGILKDTDTKISKFDTKKGDIIIMMSDGCCPDSEDCPWLVDFLCEYMSQKEKNAPGVESECEILKDKLLSLAVMKYPEGKPRDDISISVIIIE